MLPIIIIIITIITIFIIYHKEEKVEKIDFNFFKENGYLIIPNVIDKNVLNKNVNNINKLIKEKGFGKEEQIYLETNGESYGNVDKEIYDNPKIKGIIKAFFGDNVNLEGNKRFVKLLPRYSGYWKDFYGDEEKLQWHIDNVRTEFYHPIPGTMVFYLTDCLDLNAGNFTCYPGSHKWVQYLFNKYGKEGLMRDKYGRYTTKEPMTFKPKQIIAPAGSVIITHPLLIHRAGINISKNTRIGVIRWLEFAKIFRSLASEKDLFDNHDIIYNRLNFLDGFE
jgi:hypothetical protein